MVRLGLMKMSQLDATLEARTPTSRVRATHAHVWDTTCCTTLADLLHQLACTTQLPDIYPHARFVYSVDQRKRRQSTPSRSMSTKSTPLRNGVEHIFTRMRNGV